MAGEPIQKVLPTVVTVTFSCVVCAFMFFAPFEVIGCSSRKGRSEKNGPKLAILRIARGGLPPTHEADLSKWL